MATTSLAVITASGPDSFSGSGSGTTSFGALGFETTLQSHAASPYRIQASPQTVSEDASSLLFFIAIPDLALTWILQGSGILDVLTDFTDDSGVAYARYIPGSVGDQPIVQVVHGS
ncbi:MAG: hypothetical protein KAJ03_04445 [Gammaproteobacteria bacterium]|nr:hypothetical protein [Gammaproteobacteria bacterium]